MCPRRHIVFDDGRISEDITFCEVMVISKGFILDLDRPEVDEVLVSHFVLFAVSVFFLPRVLTVAFEEEDRVVLALGLGASIPLLIILQKSSLESVFWDVLDNLWPLIELFDDENEESSILFRDLSMECFDDDSSIDILTLLKSVHKRFCI